MSHRCAHPVADGGGSCRRSVADPAQQYCYLHQQVTRLASADSSAESSGCHMVQRSAHDWFCEAHMGDSSWQVARSMGALLPCTIPPEITVADKIALAQNPDCTPTTLDILSRDPVADVRYFTASHSSTPKEILQKLLVDADPTVRWAAQETLEGRWQS